MIDGTPLASALQAGTIEAAGLDVTEIEPVESHDPLLGLPNAIVTPHLAGFSPTSLEECPIRQAENIIRVLTARRWDSLTQRLLKRSPSYAQRIQGAGKAYRISARPWLFSGTFWRCGKSSNNIQHLYGPRNKADLPITCLSASTAAIHSGYSVFYSLDVVSIDSSSRFLTHVAGKKAHDCAPYSRRAGFTRSCKRTQHPCSEVPKRQLVVGNCCHGQSDALPCQTNAECIVQYVVHEHRRAPTLICGVKGQPSIDTMTLRHFIPWSRERIGEVLAGIGNRSVPGQGARIQHPLV